MPEKNEAKPGQEKNPNPSSASQGGQPDQPNEGAKGSPPAIDPAALAEVGKAVGGAVREALDKRDAPPPKKTEPTPQPRFEIPNIDPKDFLDNPREHSARVAAAVNAPLIHTYGENNVANQKAILRMEVGKENYARFADEVDEIIKGLSPEQKASPDIVRKAYDLARGGHVDELLSEKDAAIETRVEEELKKRRSTVSGGGPGGSEGKPSKLTPDQQAACRTMGISEEDYVAGASMPGGRGLPAEKGA